MRAQALVVLLAPLVLLTILLLLRLPVINVARQAWAARGLVYLRPVVALGVAVLLHSARPRGAGSGPRALATLATIQGGAELLRLFSASFWGPGDTAAILLEFRGIDLAVSSVLAATSAILLLPIGVRGLLRGRPRSRLRNVPLLASLATILAAAVLGPLSNAAKVGGATLCLSTLPLLLWVVQKRLARFRRNRHASELALAASAAYLVAAEVLSLMPLPDSPLRLFLEQVLWLGVVLPGLAFVTGRDLLAEEPSLAGRLRLSAVLLVSVLLGISGEALWSLIEHENSLRAIGASPAERILLDRLERDLLFLLGATLAATAAVALSIGLASRRVFVQLGRLMDAAGRLAAGREDARIEGERTGTCAPLIRAFNVMAERLAIQKRELRLLAEVLDGTGDVVVVINADRRIAYVNRAFERATDVLRTSTLGLPYDRLFLDPLDRRRVDSMWTKLEAGGDFTGEVVIHGRGDARFDSFVTISPIEGAGETVRWLAVHRDVSRLRDLENERTMFAESLIKTHRIGQRITERLVAEEVIDQAVEGLHNEFGVSARIWTLAAGDRCSSCEWSGRCPPRARCLQGRSADGVEHRLPLGVGAAGLAAASEEPVLVPDRQAREALFAHEVPGRDWTEPARLALPLIERGEIRAVLEVGAVDLDRARLSVSIGLLGQILSQALSNARLHDRTRVQARVLEKLAADLESAADAERTRAAELRLVNRRLVDADRLRSRFLATTSHELRTPLAGTMGFLRLILDGMGGNREEELGYLRDAYACSQHLLEVINDVLDIAKIEAGRMRFTPQPLDLAALIQDLGQAMVGEARKRDIELLIPEMEPILVEADYAHIHRVMKHVLDNAIKFTERGRVMVGIEALPDRGLARITVMDSGVGLAPEDLERVFEPFIQIEAGDTRRFGGSGLGLTLARDLLRLMGGVIRLESAGLGQGTTATFTIPLSSDELAPTEEAGVTDGDRRPEGPVVLIVDGDGAFVRRFGRVVQEAGGELHRAQDFSDALEMAQSLLPDLVVSEYLVPNATAGSLVTGIELARALADDPATADVRCVLVTGQEVDCEPIRSEAAGIRKGCLLEKPLDDGAIVRLLQSPRDAVPARCSKVLLVEDDPELEILVRRALGDERFRLETLDLRDDPLVAVGSRARDFDLLIIDPRRNGYAGYELVQSLSTKVGPPVIVLAASLAGTEEGVDSLLTSPRVAGTVSREQLEQTPHLLRREAMRAIEGDRGTKP